MYQTELKLQVFQYLTISLNSPLYHSDTAFIYPNDLESHQNYITIIQCTFEHFAIYEFQLTLFY